MDVTLYRTPYYMAHTFRGDDAHPHRSRMVTVLKQYLQIKSLPMINNRKLEPSVLDE